MPVESHADDPVRAEADADAVAGVPGVAAVYPERAGLRAVAESVTRRLASQESIAAAVTIATDREAVTPEVARVVADALLTETASTASTSPAGIVRVRVARIAES
ncbi:hypothetical protein [Leucobacter japonicus]|uniref:hypothetical protein n=1 Tax=Leucobacter japonicus TaxID=1461259 RepID=UPI0006A795C6|nr:hypothetical protein [Leucobacter japonicus]